MPISFEVEVLREGKAVSTLLGRAVQEGQVVTLVQGSFGDGRPSAIEVKAQPAVDMRPLEQSAAELPYIKGVTPEFMRHVALRWAIGGLPFSGNDDRRMGGWVRLRDMAEIGDEAVGDIHHGMDETTRPQGLAESDARLGQMIAAAEERAVL